MQYHVYLLFNDAIFISCGNGAWTLDMATTYTKAYFTAFDMIQVFPNEIRPINVNFVQGDILKELQFKSNTFDFVHTSHMRFSIPEDEFPKVILELLRVLKPNGWLDICERAGGFLNATPEIDLFRNKCRLFLFNSIVSYV